jgi:hypothetical protein
VRDGCVPNPAPPCGALNFACVRGQCTDRLPPLGGGSDAGAKSVATDGGHD